MKNIINNKGFTYPINVFVDTQVFKSEAFNFSEKGKLNFLKKQVDNGKIIFLTSDIIIGEVERHIKKDVESSINNINKLYTSRELAIFRSTKHDPVFKEIDLNGMVDEALLIFSNYLEDVGVICLHSKNINIEEIIKDYFLINPPFGTRNKKNEFPDAFNISMIENYVNNNGVVYVISGDGDFLNVENIILYEKIDELLNDINIDDEIVSLSLAFIVSSNIREDIYSNIEEQFLDIGYDLEVDGYERDRKGIIDGYSYDEIELIHVKPLELFNIEVLDYEYEDKTIILSIDCVIKFEFECSFFDDENSIWDSEDKEYSYRSYGLIKENHLKKIPLMIYLNFEYDDEEPDFNIDEIEFDLTQKFNEWSLEEDGRKIVKSPELIWENYCPDCGCGLTFHNDGGNGFCIYCAPNH